MPCGKRGVDDLTRFSNDNKRTCSGEGTDSLISVICSELGEEGNSNLHKSIVSIALYGGHKVLFASSGIAIECQCNLTRFVTSASLVSALHVVEKDHDKVKIRVLHHDGNIALGILDKYDLDYGIAVVRVLSTLDVYCIPLNYEMKLMPPGTEVVAVGRDITGVLSCSRGTLTATGESGDIGCQMLSTCTLDEEGVVFRICTRQSTVASILKKDMQGGALFGFDGSFIGMNLFSDVQRSIFLPRSIILDRLKDLETSIKKRVFLVMLKSVRDRKRRTGVECNSHQDSTEVIEERFGDEYCTGVWSEFMEGVSSKIHDVVVALASFHGESKFFECTGFFIDYDQYPTILTSASLVRDPNGLNEIVGGLKIEVLLPDNKLRVGKLKRFSLHYNVALVSIRNYKVGCPVNLENNDISFAGLVAVGRCFHSGVLMADVGTLTTGCWPGEFDCDDLCYSTCEITKAGIGGPLVDYYGSCLGLNYYGTKMRTPFLSSQKLCGILNYFKTKKTEYKRLLGGRTQRIVHIVRDDEGPPNIWLLPASDDDDELED